jgi:uncharacterized NAD(P)/FAD-binding protein YdhS
MQPVNIVVFDKSEEFWTGIPYGNRAGRSALIITALKEFLPSSEKAHFAEWLTSNWHKIAQADETVGPSTARWQETNKMAIEAGDWDSVFVPRYTFGTYLEHRITSELDSAVTEGLLTCTLKAQEVISVTRNQDGAFTLHTLRSTSAASDKADIANDTHLLVADKIILAVGSPPVRQITTPDPGCLYIGDIYEPSCDTNLHRISSMLSETEHSDILILGSNASALDILYTLMDCEKIMNLTGKVLVLSKSGSFPHRISNTSSQTEYTPEHLNALRSNSALLSSDILVAVKHEVDHATNLKIPIADIFPIVSQGVVSALNALHIDEQHKFVNTVGVEIGKLQRQAGAEYLDTVDILSGQNRLELIHGTFKNYRSTSEGEVEVEYISRPGKEPAILRRSIGVIIDCTGFQDVAGTSSPLIQSLIANGICTPNDSGRGFRVNEHLETSENCFLIGPLIAGNCNNAIRIWHAESCVRIIGLASQLAHELRSKLEEKSGISELIAA